MGELSVHYELQKIGLRANAQLESGEVLGNLILVAPELLVGDIAAPSSIRDHNLAHGGN